MRRRYNLIYTETENQVTLIKYPEISHDYIILHQKQVFP